MTNNWIILFILIPLVTGVTCLGVGHRPKLQRILGSISLGATSLFAVGLLIAIRDGSVLVSQMGGWPAPFGISIVFDSLSGLLLAASSLVASSICSSIWPIRSSSCSDTSTRSVMYCSRRTSRYASA